MNQASITAGQERLRQLEQQLEDARQGGRDGQLPELLVGLGKVHLDLGSAPQALTHFEQAIDLAQARGDREAEARCLGLKAMALAQMGNTRQALNAWNKSGRLAELLKHAALLCDAWTQRGLLLVETGDTALGVHDLERAFGLALEHNDSLRQMSISGLLGGVFARLEAPQQAHAHYAIALDLAQKLRQPAAESSFLLSLGQLDLLQHERTPAAEHFAAALQAARRAGDRFTELRALSRLLQASAQSGQADQAAFYGEQAIRLANQLGESLAELGNLHVLASFYLEQGGFEPAAGLLQRGLEIALQQPDREWELKLRTQLGYAWFGLERYAEAGEQYSQALAAAVGLNDPAAQVFLLGRLGAVTAEQGRTDEARRILQQALAQAQQLADPRPAGELHMLLAFSARDTGQVEQAVYHAGQAVEIYSQSDEELAQQARRLLAEL